MAQVLVSLGSNLNRYQNITAALDALQQQMGSLVISHIYQSQAIGLPNNSFLNAAVAFHSNHTIGQLTTCLQGIENANGRQRHNIHHCHLDIDLLTYDHCTGQIDGIALPRPTMLQYAYILKPLVDIVPNQVHPGQPRTYQQLWHAFDQASQPLTRVPFTWHDQNL